MDREQCGCRATLYGIGKVSGAYGRSDSQKFYNIGNEVGNVVRLQNRPPLPPGSNLGNNLF